MLYNLLMSEYFKGTNGSICTNTVDTGLLLRLDHGFREESFLISRNIRTKCMVYLLECPSVQKPGYKMVK
jgi:hypothetical protein